jgi:integrating conjugative element relaxase (TIGR03760 family)
MTVLAGYLIVRSMSLLSFFIPPKDRLIIRDGADLLKPHQTRIKEIRAIAGLSGRYWDQLYLKTLHNLAEYIQELPASEAHHHCERSGLLRHTIDTALFALRARRGKLLPPNAEAEIMARDKDVWTYAVFTAAIGHDLGKPISDIKVTLLDKHGKALSDWQPLLGRMSDPLKAGVPHEYKIQYQRGRNYAAHERSSPLIVHHIIPPVGLSWLRASPELFFYWTSLMTGHAEDSGILGKLVHDADKLSVASSLAGDQVSTELQQAATTSRKPLHQRIVTSLRHEIDEGRLPLNRDGAAGWVLDGKLWLVVKRALDQVRDHMTAEGQTGIPARNDRIMDELQQYGILITNGDRAVWKCRVFSPSWPKAHELTLLCLPVSKIWITEDAIPEPFDGRIEPIGADAPLTSETAQPNSESEQATANSDNDSSHIAQSDMTIASKTPVVETDNEIQQALTSQRGAAPFKTSPPSLDFATIAGVGKQEDQPPTLPTKPTAPNPVEDSPTNKGPRTDKDPVVQPLETETNPGEQDNQGEAFVHWLRDGLHQRRFPVNDTHSRIHMTADGLFLVSPAIFREFNRDQWSYVQKRFTRLKLHAKATNGTNIHEYVAKGKKKRSLIKGYLISDTPNVFPGIELPNINHALCRLNENETP